MNKENSIIVVAGPTASGKSDFAVELAVKNNGEIISADSRQIYKGLDICTGKITKEETNGVPHYMLDICSIGDEFSVSEYKKLALPILEDIFARGKTPIICGGTGQYIDALIFNQDIPKVEPNKSLREKLEKKSTDELYNELILKDLRRGEQIDKNNRVRLIRALEIIESLGKVPKQNSPSLLYTTKIYLMSPTREVLKKRIAKRLESRLKIGMINEVKNNPLNNHTPEIIKRFGLEYVAITKYLNGEINEEEMKQEIITKSMQYVKRQETWNKKYTPIAEIVNTNQ
ncbi:tRNA (adenosine(37)-N6)-dimethylallyltransferase MiaA [Candidatus Gracilibacteria bacterium]|nr:tRNA (adenosine(37)-N6)-dimethylallyltransferase MiaA [Candidatus Gracilibacteria bacterium]MCF7898872.1 tRNA (adenosine(37)-N6)-dimethylallyltransferase MiaA [Candidatus Paceibacterota bacterium]